MKNRIRELRQAKKITMKELGRELGVAESTISQYETGKRQPDNETLLRLGEFFGETVGYILGVEEKPAVSINDGLSKRERYLLERFRELDRPGQDFILQSLDMATVANKSGHSASSMENMG